MNRELRGTRPGALVLAMVATLILALGWAAQGMAQDAEPEPPALPPEILDTEVSLDEMTLRIVPLTKDELGQAAAEWQAIVKTKTEEVVAQQIAAMEAEGEVAERMREQLGELTTERKALFDKYSVIVNSWEKKGGDEAAVSDFRAYRNSIIVEETRTADFQTLLAKAQAWITAEDGGIELARDIAVIAGSLIGLFFFARIIRRLASRWIGRVPNLSKLLQVFVVGMLYWLTFAVGLAVVLSALGVDISPLFALIGGASFILAFALQGTLGNLASGLMIMLNRPFDEGDYVDVGGVAGTVRAVSIVSTTVVTPDNQVIIVPNSSVWGNVITNVTTSATRRVDLVFGISYSDDIEKALTVLKDVVAQHPKTLSEPAPVVVVGELGASSVNILCRPWAKTGDYWTVYWDLTRTVKERFDAEGISIPFPQTDIHLHNLPAPPQGSGHVSQTSGAPPAPKNKAAATAQGDDAFES